MGMLKKVNKEVGPMVRSNLLERVRVFHRREVSECFPQILLAEQSANNLATLRLGELAYRAHGSRFECRAEAVDQVT